MEMVKPDFHVNMSLEEWEELKRREEEDRRRRIREEQIKKAALFFAKFILPVILIVIGAFSIKQNGWIVLIIGIAYLALMVYLVLRESKAKYHPKKSFKTSHKTHTNYHPKKSSTRHTKHHSKK